jgi:hypothetical protein
MNCSPVRIASRASLIVGVPCAAHTARAQSFNQNVTTKSMSKYLGLLLFAVGSLTATTTASAQTQNGYNTPTANNFPYTFHNSQTGYCLGVKGGIASEGTPLITWACDGSASQAFWLGDFTATGFLTYYAQTLVSMLQPCTYKSSCWNVLGVLGGTDYQLAPVVVWPENPPNYGDPDTYNNQGWSKVYYSSDGAGHACYTFQNAGGPAPNPDFPYVLGVADGSTAEGAPVVVWQNPSLYDISPNQVWCLYPSDL